jgi:hypothetical protein
VAARMTPRGGDVPYVPAAAPAWMLTGLGT